MKMQNSRFTNSLGCRATKQGAVVCVGTMSHPDFAQLATIWEGSPQFNSLADLQRWLETSQEPPTLLLIFQSRPDEVSPRELARLQSAAPLVECWLVLGSWCEGETRTGFPAPGIRRVYWHRLLGELEHEQRVGWQTRLRHRGVCRTWSLVDEALERADEDVSPSETRLEQAPPSLMNSSGMNSRRSPVPLIFIRALERETYAATAEYCQWLGYATSWLPVREELQRKHSVQWQRKLDQASCVVWHGDLTRQSEQERLRELCQMSQPAPVIGLLHFPRHSDVTAARDCGVQTVVSLPMMVEDLRAAIERTLGETLGEICEEPSLGD